MIAEMHSIYNNGQNIQKDGKKQKKGLDWFILMLITIALDHHQYQLDIAYCQQQPYLKA